MNPECSLAPTPSVLVPNTIPTGKSTPSQLVCVLRRLLISTPYLIDGQALRTISGDLAPYLPLGAVSTILTS